MKGSDVGPRAPSFATVALRLPEAGQELRKRFARQRLGEMVPLRQVAPQSLQSLQLPYALHPLRYDPHAHGVRQPDDSCDQHRALGVLFEVLDEGAVDLQVVYREALEVGEGRVSRPEVFYRELHAQAL